MTSYLNSDFDLNDDRLVEVFDELSIWAAPFGIKLLDKIRYRKNITALDIGFGAGFPLTELAMRLGNTCKVYGIDPWEAATRRAEKKIAFYGIKNIEIITGVAEHIPLRDNSVDLITSNNGLNNVAGLAKALGECSRVMKSGGQFIQTMNLNTTMIEFYNIMEAVLREMEMPGSIKNMNEQIYAMRKPLDEVLELISGNGFLIREVDEDQFNYHFADGTAMLNHYAIRMAFLDGWKSAVPLDKQADVFQAIEERMNKKSEQEGKFKLTVPFVLINYEKI